MSDQIIEIGWERIKSLYHFLERILWCRRHESELSEQHSTACPNYFEPGSDFEAF